MTGQNSPVFLFDDVRVEPSKFQVFKAGNAVQIEPKTFSLLLFLIENRGRLVEKDEILNTVWKGAFVTENALAREITKLRKTLQDDPRAARYIQTVHTRGYRFIAEVQHRNGAAEVDTKEEIPVAAGEVQSDFALTDRVSSVPTVIPESDRRKFPLLSRKAVVVLSCAVLVILFTAGFLWKQRARRTQSPPASSIFSVGVLPFKISGGTQNDEYLGVEIADSLTNRLSSSKNLSVVPVTTVLHFAGSNQDPQAVGRALNVDFVLSGEIDKAKQHVTTQLIRVRDGVSLLTGNYDEKFNDIFQLEDSISAKVLANLVVTVDHEEMQRLRKRYTENDKAYEAFLMAHYLMGKFTKEDELKSIEQFQQAIALDPKYAMAYAGLSDAYMRLGTYGVAPAEFLPPSRAAAMKALELDETVAYAHSMLGRIAYQYDWDFARAGREFARTRELDPKLTHAWFGSYLLVLKRVDEAEAEQQRFEDFLPYIVGTRQIQHFYFTRQYDRAIDALSRKLEAKPTFAPLHEWLGLVYEQQGRTAEAIEECQKAITLSQGIDGVGALGHIYAVSGRVRDAENSLRMLDELTKKIYVSPYEMAVIYAGLGKQDRALNLIEKAYRERSLLALSIQFDPRLNKLREDPRFQDFMRRTGIPL
jgi:DNA-binding winged helix-turn-helix (wHTH) protein/TolB-like protein